MRLHRVWHRVGPPTWKRSGTIVFAAVMGVLLIGGTAMAANLGLLTSTAPDDRGYRLEVPRPALSVSLPPTTSTSSGIDPTTSSSTAVDDDVDGDTEDDVDDAGPDDGVNNRPPETGRSAEAGDASDESIDDDDDDDDDPDSESEEASSSAQEADDRKRDRSESDGRKVNDLRPRPDGGLDDD